MLPALRAAGKALFGVGLGVIGLVILIFLLTFPAQITDWAARISIVVVAVGMIIAR